MLKFKYVFLFYLVIIAGLKVYAQQPLDNHISEIMQNTYFYGDSVSAVFYAENLNRINDINLEVFNLPIDKCRIDYIIIKIYVDPIGMAQEAIILSGTGNPRIDNRIKKTVVYYPGLWKTPYWEGTAVYFTGLIVFMPSVLNMFSILQNRGLNNKLGYRSRVYGNWEACEQNEYYFNEGLKCFKKEDYKGSVKFFKKAIEYNRFDFDALYNLGISYVRRNDLIKACEWFGRGSENGDPSAEAAWEKHCSP